MKAIHVSLVAGLWLAVLAGCSSPTNSPTNNSDPVVDSSLPKTGLLVWYGWEDGYATAGADITNLAKAVPGASGIDGGKVWDVPNTGDPTKAGGAHGKYMDNVGGENTNLPPLNLPGQAVTLAVWVNLVAEPTNAWQRIFTTDDHWKGADTPPVLKGFTVFLNQTDSTNASPKVKLGFGFPGWTDVQADVTSALTFGAWHQLVVSDSSGTVKFYVDGTLVSTQTTSSQIGDTSDKWSSFGRALWDNGQHFGQKYDEAMIWNRALTDAEVGSVYRYIKNLP